MNVTSLKQYPLVSDPLVNMDVWSSLYHALPRHVAVLSHTKPGINFKSIVRWYSLSSDNSYHYHVYSVLLLIYLCLCRCRHYYSCNNTITDGGVAPRCSFAGPT